ncbi:MAG: hypothetical protein RJA52_85, partial [Bacteroidota bacterium]
VAQSSTHIFYATDGQILSINKMDGDISTLSAVDGLSHTGISFIEYIPSPFNALAIIYDNALIDLILENEIFTLRQIQNFRNFTGEKKINSVRFDGKSNLLVSANYGISKINLQTLNFEFTTFTGIEIEDFLIYQNHYFLTTQEGIYFIEESNNFPENFNSWQLLNSFYGFPDDYSSHTMSVFDNKLLFNMDDSFYSWDQNNLLFLHSVTNQYPEYISVTSNGFLLGYNNDIFYSSSITDIPIKLPDNCSTSPIMAIENPENGELWFADGWRNFKKLKSYLSPSCEELTFNSPYSANNYAISIHNGNIWIASGGVTPTFSYRFLDHGIFRLSNGFWDYFNRWNVPEFKGNQDDALLDFITIAARPSDGKIFAGSFFEGLAEFDGIRFTVYNEKNSTLNNAIGDINRTRVSGLAFDKDENLWISNHLAANPISMLSKDGTWKNYSPSCNVTEIHQLVVDDSGNKWAVSNSNSIGLIIFNEGSNDSPLDDRCRIVNNSNSELPSNLVNCIVKDINNEIWVGTSSGIVIFDCGNNALENNCRGSRRIFEQNGIASLLLSSEDVLSLTIDGANRKWAGTRNGVFLLSADGRQQILHFNTENSPLPSNFVHAIAVEPETGIVYFGTQKGLVSFKSDATESTSFHKKELKIFPNPVLSGSENLITIDGLANNSTVKITDVQGRLVNELKSNGGRAIWNGLDLLGKKVHSGVYLVFASNANNFFGTQKSDGVMGKIYFIR